MLPPPHQERELAQQYRQIKRPLINNAIGRGGPLCPHGNLLMVASAVPGEGKTFTVLNLALSMRLEEDVTVLLVDGDVVNPRLSQVLGVDERVRAAGSDQGSQPAAGLAHHADGRTRAVVPAGRPTG